MKIPLNLGPNGMATHDVPAPNGSGRIALEDPRSALTFLRRFAADPLTMMAIRRQAQALDLDLNHWNDDEVLQKLAFLVSDGTLRVARPEVVERRFYNVQVLDAAEEETKPREDEGKKWPPDPLVPPEYITMAWLESNEVKRARDWLEEQIEKFRYNGFVVQVPDSSVAPEYVRAAKTSAAAIDFNIDTVNYQLSLNLFDQVELVVPASVVAKEYVAAAQLNTAAMKATIDSVNAHLEAQIADGVALAMKASVVSREYRAAALTASENITAAVASVNSFLGSLL